MLLENGRNNGVYTNWSDCESQVKGHSNNDCKSFTTRDAANAYMSGANSSSNRSGSGHSSSAAAATSSPCSSKSKSSDHTVKIYTDGSLKNNQGKQGNKQGPSKAGYGVYYGENDRRNCSGRVSGEQTNQRGELEGIRHALSSTANEVRNGSSKNYRIYTDSQASKEAIDNWANHCERSGGKTSTGSTVANQDLIKDCHDMYNEIKAGGANIDIIKVQGHSGNYGNDMADKMAVEGCDK